MSNIVRTVGIIGTGNLGEYLAKMLLRRPRSLINPVSVIGSVRNPIRKRDLLHRFGPSIDLVHDNRTVVRKSNVVILAVKPGQMKQLCQEITPCISTTTPIISTAAAVPLDQLHEWLPTARTVIRCMPNIPCSIGTGLVTYYSKSNTASEIMKDIFDPNEVLAIMNDAGIDASTLIAGCGPAFFAWYIECLKKVGENVLSAELLDKMLTQTMIGTATMLQTHTPIQIIRAVASPKGATEAALTSLNTNQVDEKIHAAILTAHKRIETISTTL